MKKKLKARIAVFLCLLMTIPALAGALPQAKLEAQAASKRTHILVWSSYGMGNETGKVRVTKKTKDFYIGDYVYAYSYVTKKQGNSYDYIDYQYYGYLSLNKGVKYKSSRPSIVSVNKDGLITPKKQGDAKITITFKGRSVQCNISVVSKLGKASTYFSVEKAGKSMIKAYKKGITSNNRYDLVSRQNVYEDSIDYAAYKKNGVAMRNGLKTTYGYENGVYSYTSDVIAPVLARANAISSAIDLYVEKKNPTGSGSSKMFKVTKVSGQGSVVTVNLQKRVTAAEIFGLKAAVSSAWDTKIKAGKTAEFPVYIRDTKTGHRYYATATAVEGKNILTVNLKSLRMKSKNRYKLEGMEIGVLSNDWTNTGKVTFRAK